MKVIISRRLKKIIKWASVTVIAYFVLTTIYFGYDDIDPRTGNCNFYWSGIDELWNDDKTFGFKINEPFDTRLNGIDGPYIIGNKVYTVNAENKLTEKNLDRTKLLTIKTGLSEIPEFSVELKNNYPVENEEYEMPEKLIAVSDIEGNFTAFYSLLLSNKVIDKKGNWIFGKGHLILNGDFFDRGSQVTQLLWLIYHLESQALKSGGKVHYILGNHEIMNLYGNASDNDFKYIEAAKRISGQTDWDKAVRYLYSENSELGKWLRSKNIIEKIGDVLFAHGGLNPNHSKEKFTLSDLNETAHSYIGTRPLSGKLKNAKDELVVGTLNSPYWDRRLNFDWKNRLYFLSNGIKAKETTQKELEDILMFYGASKLVIGHSVVEDISSGYEGKVIKIDVEHSENMRSGKTKGLLIEDEEFYKIDDLGSKHSFVDHDG